MDTLNLIFQAFAALVGFPAFLMSVINLAKYFGLPDNAADAVNFWGNVVAYVGVAVLVFTGKLDLLGGIDEALVGLAKLLADILIILSGSVTSMVMARVYHKGARGLPLIGASHSKGFRPLF